MQVFDRDVFFDNVREKPLGGSLDQGQVDGLNALLDAWEEGYSDKDRRWLGYCLATQLHETASTCQPIEEYEGSSASYGQVDPETGQRYFGRGYVQLTHRANYEKADIQLDLGRTKADATSCEWHAENALDPIIAARVLYEGSIEGWFRSDSKGPHTLARYFNETTDDPYNAREIINGDKSKVPSWSGGVSIGNLIKSYYMDFTAALNLSYEAALDEEEEGPDVPVAPTDPTEGGRYEVYVLRVSAGATVELLKADVNFLPKPKRSDRLNGR